jgi:hypothetical protein
LDNLARGDTVNHVLFEPHDVPVGAFVSFGHSELLHLVQMIV